MAADHGERVTAAQALDEALAWVDGRRSWMNLGPHEPYTPDVIAVMDAQEVVKWSALAAALAVMEAMHSASREATDA